MVWPGGTIGYIYKMRVSALSAKDSCKYEGHGAGEGVMTRTWTLWSRQVWVHIPTEHQLLCDLGQVTLPL